MTEQFTEGDIIQGNQRDENEAIHPIVYFEEIDDMFFLGAMITHSKAYGNIRLEDSHFNYKIDDNPEPSFFVKNYLVKKQEWAPYTKIGELSKSGIEYIKSNLNDTKPEIWENYLTK
ncbi:hypothetical protein [Polaribacter sp. 11A2H]|uniref:hypothetical protein n=1 Tax=Polaribacter sp. 11A2H TaxID=2687290 RepID=UPI0014073B97|nr:hypothetical protein [Polaribacter sp. 11A2H]